MEHIEIDHFASDEQRARAITELVTIELPPDAKPGPIGGSDRIKHGFFDIQCESDHERMVCYYSDIYKENFPVDTNNQLWVVDFDQAGVLPESFMSLTLERPLRHPIPWEYRKDIPIERTRNLKAMLRAAWWFKIGASYGCRLPLSFLLPSGVFFADYLLVVDIEEDEGS